MKLLLSVHENLHPFLNFDFFFVILSKKLFDSYNIDSLIGHWEKGKSRCKSEWRTVNAVNGVEWLLPLWLIIFSKKIISGKYCEMTAGCMIFPSISADLSFVSLKYTSPKCLKKQDTSLELKLHLSIKVYSGQVFIFSFISSGFRGSMSCLPHLLVLISSYNIPLCWKKSHCFPWTNI